MGGAWGDAWAVEGDLCLREVLEVLEVIRCVLLGMLEAVEGEVCLLEVLEVMRCVLLCMPAVVEGGSVCRRSWR